MKNSLTQINLAGAAAWTGAFGVSMAEVEMILRVLALTVAIIVPIIALILNFKRGK